MRHKILMRSLLLLGLVTVAATSLTAASLPSPDDAPEVTSTPNAPGFYLVGGRSLDPGVFHHAGELQIWSWADLHSGPNSFNWGYLDQFIAAHYLPPGPGQPGKKAAIAITPYQGRSDAGATAMPDWVRATPNTTIPGVLTQEVTNGSFANGLNSWEAVGQVSGDLGFARLGGDQAGAAQLEQYNVRIPFVLSQGSFSFWWRSAVSGGVSDPEDIFKVEVLDGSDLVVEVLNLNNLTDDPVWRQVAVDLAPYDGHWATLRFSMTNDGDGTTTTVDVDDVVVVVQPILPKYWDPAYQNLYNQFVSALGVRYRADDRVEFIAIGAGLYGETRASDIIDRPATVAGGLTDWTSWVTTVNQITEMYRSAFTVGGSLRKVLQLQYAPYQYRVEERKAFSEYAANRDVGLAFNGLYFDWNGAESVIYPNAGSYYGLGAYDPLLLYQDQVPAAFETYSYMLGDSVGLTVGNNRADAFYWGVLNALDKHVDYLRMSTYSGWYLGPNDTPVQDYTDIMQWAKPYFGATLDHSNPRFTPSVWVAMRDHITPICYWGSDSCEFTSRWPVLGNFEFWLYQKDSAPGGKTIPETHIEWIQTSAQGPKRPDLGLCPGASAGPIGYPCYTNANNPDLPTARESFVIRRTDQATSNDFMYFDIDDGYMFDGNYTADIKVTYWDTGIDQFRLQYESTSGPKYAVIKGTTSTVVTKQNSNQFRTVTFSVDDARFADGLSGSTDFALDSRNVDGVKDGNEWIHFADVRRSCYRYDVHPLPPACDGDVDIVDVLTVASCFEQPVSASCPALLDFNSLNGVDIADIVAVADQWGWPQ